MMRVAGDGKEVVRRAAGAAARLVSAVEVLALFEVSDAPNLCIKNYFVAHAQYTHGQAFSR